MLKSMRGPSIFEEPKKRKQKKGKKRSGYSILGGPSILDEPSIGLHPRDINRLIDTFYHLRSLGNTVVVIEHDKSEY